MKPSLFQKERKCSLYVPSIIRSICKNILVGLSSALLCHGAAVADSLPGITARSWLVADQAGNILHGENVNEVRSIASITKLMTVMIVLDSEQSLDEKIPIKLHNKNLTRKELIDLAIVKSDNEAARLLCQYYVSGYKNCIKAMNEKAQNLQMYDTVFTDPTGRLSDNRSTAVDLIKLVLAASNYPLIVEASNKDTIRINNNKKVIEFHNTNTLVGRGYHFIVTKTGFINQAGGCIVLMMETENGIRTVILLGSKNTKTRIPEAKILSAMN